LLQLLGYAMGSIVMYWGLLLLLVSPWMLILLLVMLINRVWSSITGKHEEWQWVQNWTESILSRVHPMLWAWLAWIPGVLI